MLLLCEEITEYLQRNNVTLADFTVLPADRMHTISPDYSIPQLAPFTQKILQIIAHSENVTSCGEHKLLDWTENGLSIQLREIERFGTEILPIFFNQRSHYSFIRQLNAHGFKKNDGLAKLANGEPIYKYSHRSFLRDNSAEWPKVRRESSAKRRSASTSNISKRINSKPNFFNPITSNGYQSLLCIDDRTSKQPSSGDPYEDKLKNEAKALNSLRYKMNIEFDQVATENRQLYDEQMNIKASLDNSELQLNRLTALYTRAFECPVPISPEEEQRIIEEVMIIQQKIHAYDKYRGSFYPQDIKESLKIEVPQENIANYPVKLERQASYQGSQYSMNSAMTRPEMIPIPSSNGSAYSPNQYLMHHNASVSSKGLDNLRQHSQQPGPAMQSNASGSSSGYETSRQYSSGVSMFSQNSYQHHLSSTQSNSSKLSSSASVCSTSSQKGMASNISPPLYFPRHLSPPLQRARQFKRAPTLPSPSHQQQPWPDSYYNYNRHYTRPVQRVSPTPFALPLHYNPVPPHPGMKREYQPDHTTSCMSVLSEQLHGPQAAMSLVGYSGFNSDAYLPPPAKWTKLCCERSKLRAANYIPMPQAETMAYQRQYHDQVTHQDQCSQNIQSGIYDNYV